MKPHNDKLLAEARIESAIACLRHIHDRLIEYPEFETLRFTINEEIRSLLGKAR